MINGVRETSCMGCLHREVCVYRGKYLDMVKHLQEEFVDYMTDENRSFMAFKDPDCKFCTYPNNEKGVDVPSFLSSGTGMRTLSPAELFGDEVTMEAMK